ncbi:Transposase, partial [Bryocella elongata]
MKKSRFSEEQIIGILKQHEAGVKTAELCREHGISAATFYAWKPKYGGMDVAEAQRLKGLEDENRGLKLAGLRAEVAFVQAEHGLSECRACKLLHPSAEDLPLGTPGWMWTGRAMRTSL